MAHRAARLIDENHSTESSVVYGLEGPWGSGKSSVIAMITTYLTELENSRWQVVPFTPWATSGTEGLLSEFFAALVNAGRKLTPLRRWKVDPSRRFVVGYLLVCGSMVWRWPRVR
ncbi:P-loop NTPase fold protein [Georgenia daeguensis]|uniref:P-loop NTPase fold protein n=1 Tax=Georgenia daeguensis TaxID=908355 RepID=UPI003CD05FC4